MPSGSVTSAIASTGSNAPVEVVPGGGAHQQRHQAGAPVLGDQGGQRLGVHRQHAVGGHRPHPSLGMPATRASFSSDEWVSDVP
jgi:hypothetical protein